MNEAAGRQAEGPDVEDRQFEDPDTVGAVGKNQKTVNSLLGLNLCLKSISFENVISYNLGSTSYKFQHREAGYMFSTNWYIDFATVKLV
jgi:hypothetical protein